jgi:protein ImuB
MEKRVMCIWLPNWPCQRAFVAKLQADPQPTNVAENSIPQKEPVGPILLYRRDPRRGNIVATANQMARQAGILPQMPLSQCGSLCPSATVVEHDPQRDIEALVQLAESAQCFSPIVGLESLDNQIWAGRSLHEPQSIYMDVTGISPLFDGEERLATEVIRWFRQRELIVTVAIANQIGQAWAKANYSFRTKVAQTLLQMELGQCNDSEENIAQQQFLAINDDALEQQPRSLLPLPIEALRIDLATTAKLHRLGIRNLAQLSELPRASLPSRFGDGLLRRLDQFFGREEEPFQTICSTPELNVTESFEYATPDREDVLSRLQKQLQQLCSRLETLGHGALRVVCRVSLEKNALDMSSLPTSDAPQDPSSHQQLASVLQVGLYIPSNDTNHLECLLRTQLESPACKIGGTYWAKGLATQITMSAPMVWQQNSLFEVESLKHRESIAKLIDNLSVRLGRENVVAPTILHNPLPELTYSWRPLTGWRKDGQQQEIKRKLGRAPKRDYQSEESAIGPKKEDAWRRPTRLLSPPLALNVTEFSNTGLPAIVRYPRANSNVRRCTGPERLESGWWEGTTQQRDYYRMELENGVWLWCFLDHRNKGWFLHGIFD